MTTNTPNLSEPEGQPLSALTANLREQIIEAQAMLTAGDIKGAESLSKATLQLIKAVEAQVKLEEAQKSETKRGVTYDADDIAQARKELLRRFDRLAKTLNAPELCRGAE
ncbi:hypothetical protein [Ponticaulis sp.]|uniref:hypothetical protein n=1 Tax=Ponticaulis sp. TaxID=2020902 RepID=UPI000B70D66B|nr:hypothetical protein [Ponticaulis sp.]MAI90400.1 hypothetical protein [Ponticaulis sp.]OUY00102.1 MAG: hypothetical protein CBB65_08170 [Hyphomonadaceae bacterium TMED5]|tara:strand:+ start:15503 stop:15832 length:330 start_codon:yes stop_codon:yes gene_type:complete